MCGPQTTQEVVRNPDEKVTARRRAFPVRIGTMVNLMFLAGRLSQRKVRSRLTGDARQRRRPRKAVARFTAHVSLLEERWLMAGLNTPVPMPVAPTGQFGKYNTVGSLSDVLFTGNSNVPVATKTFTFFNNTDQTVYPFLYDTNIGQPKGTKSYYDPLDAPDQEYRAYIGYSVGDSDYLGLQAGKSITITIPLVFWDAGRAAIVTDGADLIPKDTNTNPDTAATNPFYFYYKNLNGSSTLRYVENAASGGDGIVMFYHATDTGRATNPGADAPEQLIEWTIRDLNTMTAINKINTLPKAEIKTLINYDVSYVDNLLLPVAMEAQAVPVPNTDPVVTDNFGWIGAKDAYRGNGSLQAAIEKFTRDGVGNGLGHYFEVDGKDLGWPTFYNPNYTKDPSAGRRIPSGASLFLSSPLADKVSTYNSNRWMLSSGGDGPIKYSASGKFSTPNKAVLTAGTGVDDILKALRPGMKVTGDGPNSTRIVLGTISRVDVDSKTVVLNQNLNIPDGTQETFDFFPVVTDPYSTKITDLWYSWAKFYQDQIQKKYPGFKSEPVTAKVTADTDAATDLRILTLQSTPTTPLAVGMQVKAQGYITYLTTILKIETVDGVQQIYLSRPVTGATSGQSINFTFFAPPAIAFAAQTTNIPIVFDKGETSYATAFAADVYELLSVYSTADKQDPELPASMAIVENAIGGNVGYLPTGAPIEYRNISADLRDLGKSALRGVPNFADPATPESTWYPDPAKRTGRQSFNVYNLDPYVWFVHRVLHLSGYGFSFDDDISDVDATGSSTLYIAVGGLKSLPNQDEWSPSATWGTKQSMATISNNESAYPGKTVISLEGKDSKTIYNQLKADGPEIVGAYVTSDKPGLIPKGTNLAATGLINKNQFILSEKVVNPPAGPVLLTFSGRPPA
jgi:hypothetical protein